MCNKKVDFKNATGADVSKFAKKVDLASLKSEVDKLDIDKLEKVPNGLNSFKNKVDKLDVDKLVSAPVDLSKLSDVVIIEMLKEMHIMLRSKDIEDKIPDVNNLVANTTLNAKINEVKNKIPNISNLATTTALTAVDNKRTDHSKCITTTERNSLIAENFTARLKQANWAAKVDIADFIKKRDFDEKLKNLNKKVTSNKSKHLLVESELKKLLDEILNDGVQLYLIFQTL